MVQWPEEVNPSLSTNTESKKIAQNAQRFLNSIGKKNNICEIGKERIRRAAAKIRADHPESTFDGGFRVFKVDSSNMEDVYHTPAEYSQDKLEYLETNIKEDRNDLDLLFEAVLRGGLELSMSHKIEEIDGFTVHNYDDDSLLACFDDNISEAVFKEIAGRDFIRAVFKDSSFAGDTAKTRALQIFKDADKADKVRVM